eukprot:jgi/Chrpa1/5695/Chrysochromulina_OHIO_Genome00012547-RA
MLPCTETSDVPGLNRGLQLTVPSHRRELQTAVSTSAGLTSALANTAVSRIVLASGTYNLTAELSITRSVILEAAAGATVTLNAQASSSSPRRVLNINPGSSGVVQLIGLGITGGYTAAVLADVLAPTHACTTAVNYSRCVPQRPSKVPIAPMGTLLTCWSRLTLAQLQTLAQPFVPGGGVYVMGTLLALCVLMFKSSHRPDGEIADVLALTHACTTANASVNYRGWWHSGNLIVHDKWKLSWPKYDGKKADVLARTHACTTAANTGGACRRDLQNFPSPPWENHVLLVLQGGGIIVKGAVTILSTISGNTAPNVLAHVQKFPSPDGKMADVLAPTHACATANALVNYRLCGGGVIVIQGTVSIVNSQIHSNTAGDVRAHLQHFPSPPYGRFTICALFCRAAVSMPLLALSQSSTPKCIPIKLPMCVLLLKSSHRPDGKNADAPALILAFPTADDASVNYRGPMSMLAAAPGHPVGSLALSEGASASAKARMTRAQELLKAWELDAREITILEKQLGEGGQGVVVRGLWHGIEVAIKQPRLSKGRSGKQNAFGSTSALDSYNQALRREVRALSRVRHPNVIKLYGVCLGPAPMLLMSYAPSGTLQDALDDHKFQTPLEMVRLLAGIARGMDAVHAHKIIHLDLKPENVLIGPLDVPWITDFGLSTSSNMTSMSQSTVGGRGTLPFKAPELFAHPPHVGPEADVYAFAILAWIVVCGEQPYANMLAAATSLPQAVAQGVRPTLADPNEEWQDKTTLPMVRLIEGCWHADSAQRPTFGSGSGEGAEGGEDGGKGLRSRVVEMLEKMEHSLSKGSDLEASQLALAMRLISTESEAETLSIS